MRVIFTQSTRTFSKLIQKLTGSKWSHVGILVGYRLPVIIHSHISGVDIDCAKPFIAKSSDFAVLYPPPSFEYGDLSALVEKYERRRYDYFGILYLAAHLLSKKYLGVSLPWAAVLERSNSMLCMEFATKILHVDGVEHPGALYDLLVSQGWTNEPSTTC
jgi:hypothetical protein